MTDTIEQTAESRELELHIDNTESHYLRALSCFALLARGRYSFALAPKAFRPMVDDAARDYVRQFGGTMAQVFPVAIRNETAASYAREFESAQRNGTEGDLGGEAVAILAKARAQREAAGV